MDGSFQGDLADVVRSGGGGVVAAAGDSFPAADQFIPPDPSSIIADFGDPFSSFRDPFEGVVSSTSTSGSFHGGFMEGMRDDGFQISCDREINVNCDLRGLITPGVTCDLRDGLMSMSSSSSPKDSSSFGDMSRINQISSPRNPILKRRKSQAKKVVCIPAPTAANSRQGGGEVVPSDLWAWRKYGQKPIKGSPYPRGYYRCSSSKGCSARKQVERSRTDPNMLVITYTSEHNHPWPTQRNSLAGSSRIPAAATSSSSKPSPPPTTTVKEETDPHHVDQSKSSVKPDHKTIEDNKGNDVVLPSSQVMVNDELGVFDYDKSYRPLIDQEGGPDQGFFAELRGLEESDPLINGFLFDRGNKSTVDVDPFGSLFDWSTSANSNATTTTTNSSYRREDNS